MRYGLFAALLTAFVAFAAQPVMAECAGHTKTAEKPASSTLAGTIKQSKSVGG